VTKRFAWGDSPGPDVANLQLKFWQLALEMFDRIVENWRTYAVDEEGEGPETSDDYTENEFVIDAAVALVLAGTSVSELIGQNVYPDGDKTPHLRSAYKKLVRPQIPDDVETFFSIYDALRHFGPAKHTAVDDITEEGLCKYFKTAQSIWQDVLKKRGAEIGDEFRRDFRFPV
jgi:hypothetical protein